MSSYIRQRVKACVSAAKAKLDQQAADAVDDLLARIMPIKSMRVTVKPQNEDELACTAFKGENCGMIVGDMPNALVQVEKDIDDMRKSQFATVAEMRMYCAGTEYLFPLLMLYHHTRTEKALIMAMPNANVYRNGKASIEAKDLKEFYDKTRSVSVVIAFGDGFICFSFEEKIKP